VTDRYAGFVVTLADDIRKDDAESVMIALRMVKGVIGVSPMLASGYLHIAEHRARIEVREKVWQLWKSMGE